MGADRVIALAVTGPAAEQVQNRQDHRSVDDLQHFENVHKCPIDRESQGDYHDFFRECYSQSENTMTYIHKRLRSIREYRHLSRAQLAQACGGKISERQIARIESGEIRTTRQNTIKVLADGLRVAPGELTGDRPLPEYIRTESKPMEVGETFPVGGKFRPELRLAFDLVRHRYGWDEQRIIALAPLMFVLLTERCIAWQAQRLADLNAQLKRFDKQISSRIKAMVGQDNALTSVSIKPDEKLPEHFHRTFGEYLRAFAADIPTSVAEPMVSELWGGPQGRVCEEHLDRVTGGSHHARLALEYGDVRLDDIPDELKSDEASDERARWLEERLSNGVKSMLRERSMSGLPIGPRSIEKWAGTAETDDR